MNQYKQELAKCRDILKKIKKGDLGIESLEVIQEIQGELEKHPRLSDREFQVLCRLGSGMTVPTIASELGITSKTVETYRESLKQKLGCETSHQLLFVAFRYISRIETANA